jgi:hypothetical protein
MRPLTPPPAPLATRVRHATTLVALAATLAGASACADAPLSASSAQAHHTMVTTLDVEDRLLDEKARIAAALEASEATYDSLSGIWDAYQDGDLSLDDERFTLCDPLQYVATVKIIGEAGGTLDFGPHTLRIPAGALDGPTVITAEGLTSLRVEARFAPHGLRFHRPVSLELSRKHCEGHADRQHRIVYLGDGTDVREWIPSDDDDAEGEVRARIAHFSAYAVAY